MRGKACVYCGKKTMCGITPAYAGKRYNFITQYNVH